MVVETAVTTILPVPGIQVPLTALERADGHSAYVHLVQPNDHRVTAREVKIGTVTGDSVLIEHGLFEGDLVIVRSSRQVVAGDRVRWRVLKSSSPSMAQATGSDPMTPGATQ